MAGMGLAMKNPWFESGSFLIFIQMRLQKVLTSSTFV